MPALTRPGRYHLTLTVRGQVVLHGWWDDADVAEAKCAGLVREHQDHGGVEVRLTELDDDEREWPLSEWVSPGSG
ncbi:hypothetical protein ACIBL6_35695 [Streptomyces sp. NPDC050400]|uniref:hypothetical protein n=1 Tax=Streptomyces sp. NPDC050400 TaxID=3365610 RepID=UPI003796F207